VSDRPLAIVTVAFAIGIVLAESISAAGWALILAAILIAAIFVSPANVRPTAILIILMTAAGACRYACSMIVPADDVSRFVSQINEIEGKVVSDVSGTPEAKRLTFRVKRAKIGEKWLDVSGRVMLSIYADKSGKTARVQYGDRLRLKTHLYLPEPPSNPGIFSWKAYLAKQGIYSCASIRTPRQAIVLRHGNPRSIVGAALAAKRYLVRSIARIHPPAEAHLMSGVIFGSYSYLDDETLLHFQRAGTLHILAASGYNCFIVILLANPLLKLLRIRERLRGPVIIALIVAYVLMIGPAPSILRAAIMSALLLLALPLGRVGDRKNLFFAAGLILLAYNPANLFDVGFQLSFLAVAALVWVSPIVENVLRSMWSGSDEDVKVSNTRTTPLTGVLRRLIREAVLVVVGTTAVTLVTAPLVAYYFNYTSVVSMPANLVAVLAVPVLFLDSILSALTALIPHAEGFIGLIGTLSARGMLWSMGWLGSLRYGAISVQVPGVLGLAGYYLLLCSGLVYLSSKYAE
jgi:competence protein ComEC